MFEARNMDNFALGGQEMVFCIRKLGLYGHYDQCLSHQQ